MKKPYEKSEFIEMLLGYGVYDWNDSKLDPDGNYKGKRTNQRYLLWCVAMKRFLVRKGFSEEQLMKESQEVYKKHGITGLLEYFEPLVSKKRTKTDEITVLDDEPGATWAYFRSYIIEGYGYHRSQVKHRLYLYIDFEYRKKFADVFMKKCAEKGISYYFKVSYAGGHNDTVVLYIDNPYNVKRTINVINEIFSDKQYAEIKDHTRIPGSHLYEVNRFIGYGFEPPLINGQNYSYTEFMRMIVAQPDIKDMLDRLKNRIKDDFVNGRISYYNNIVKSPSRGEINEFLNARLDEKSIRIKHNFFVKYSQYFHTKYGREIMLLMNTIEKRVKTMFPDSENVLTR